MKLNPLTWSTREQLDIVIFTLTFRLASIHREAYLYQFCFLARLVSVCPWSVCGRHPCAQAPVALWPRGRGASGCGTWGGTFLSYSCPRWNTLSKKPLGPGMPVPLLQTCIQWVFLHRHMTKEYSSLRLNLTWSLPLRRVRGLKFQSSCEDKRRMWLLWQGDVDLTEMVLEAFWGGKQRGWFQRSAERVEGEAMPPCPADVGYSAGEALLSHCW